MNSTAKGIDLEGKIFDLFSREIATDDFLVKKECCQIFRQRAYYSKDRECSIKFDVSIEVSRKGDSRLAMVFLIECKNYAHPVPVDDVEEFAQKIAQVAGANVKGILVTRSALQKSALRFAKNRGIGVMRYFDDENRDWVLPRSTSAGVRVSLPGEFHEIEQALENPEFRSRCFDLYCQSPLQLTQSVWDLFEDLLGSAELPESFQELLNSRSKLASRVRYLEREQIESVADHTLCEIEHEKGCVDLAKICDLKRNELGLSVLIDVPQEFTDRSTQALGTINFEPLEIRIFREAKPHEGRQRFTLAHELGHLLLHSGYIKREICRASDLGLTQVGIDQSDIARMEWQANYFASCLLLPRKYLFIDLVACLGRFDVQDRGWGLLFVDNQQVNLDSYFKITSWLKNLYGVSRSALTIRLTSLGWMRDARDGLKSDEEYPDVYVPSPRSLEEHFDRLENSTASALPTLPSA